MNNASGSNPDSLRRKPKRLRLEKELTSIIDGKSANIDDGIDESKGCINHACESSRGIGNYQLDEHRFLTDLSSSLRPVRRKLPAIHTMLAAAPQQSQSSNRKWSANAMKSGQGPASEKHVESRASTSSTNIPLLQQFFAEMSQKFPQVSQSQSQDATNTMENLRSDKSNIPQCPLQNPSTLLTKGHHERFQELLSIFGNPNTANKDRLHTLSHRDRSARKKEFQTLTNLFRQERQLYAKALLEFQQMNQDRFWIGFKKKPTKESGITSRSEHASDFVTVKSQRIHLYQNVWEAYINGTSNASGSEIRPSISKPGSFYYGPCIQTVSINHRVNNLVHNNAYETSKAASFPSVPSFTMETFSPKIIHKRILCAGEANDWQSKTRGGAVPKTSVQHIQDTFQNSGISGARIKPPFPIYYPSADKEPPTSPTPADKSPISLLLCQDTFARALALEHKVDVVLTELVLESLLKDPQWILPISYQTLESDESCIAGIKRNAVFMDDPLPAPTISRHCLCMGYTEALYQQFSAVGGSDEESQSSGNVSSLPNEYVYTLLKVVRQGHSINLLVRSQNRILTELGDPVCFETSLEYFHNYYQQTQNPNNEKHKDLEIGMEVIPACDRAYWFIQKILQPTKRLLLCRIDPASARILDVKEKTVADAITPSDEAANERGVGSLHQFDPSLDNSSMFGSSSVEPLINSMFDVVFAATKLERDGRSSIMCYPGRYGTVATGNVKLTSSSISAASVSAASVHKEIQDFSKSVVDMQKEFKDAHQVFLKPDYRPWYWNNDRCAFTFPI